MVVVGEVLPCLSLLPPSCDNHTQAGLPHLPFYRASPKSRRDYTRWPFPGNRKTHSPVASAAAFCIPVRRASGCSPESPRSSPGMLPHSVGSSCTKTPSRAAHRPATTSSANKSPLVLLGPETCPLSRSASSGGVSSDRQLARYTAPRSKYLLLSSSADFPRSETTLLPASAIPLQSAPPPALLPRSNSDSPHARPEQSTIPPHSARHAPPGRGSAITPATPAVPHKKTLT